MKLNALEIIKNEIQKLEKEYNNNEEIINFYEDFIFKNSTANIVDIADMDFYSLFLVTLFQKLDISLLGPLKSKFETAREIFNSKTRDEAIDFINMTTVAAKVKMKYVTPDVKKQFSKYITSTDYNFKEEFDKEYDDKKEMEYALVVNEMGYLYICHKDITAEAFNIVMNAIRLRNTIEHYKKIIMEYYLPISKITRLTKKEQVMLLEEAINEEADKIFITDITSKIEKVITATNTSYSIYIEKKKEIKNRLNNYRKLYEYFDKIDDKKQTSFNNEILKIDDENIRCSLIKEIYLHNLKIQKEIDKKYNNLKNGISDYKVLFNKYGINIDKYDYKTDKSTEEIQNILQKISDIGIDNEKSIMSIIRITNAKLVNLIASYITKGILNKDFLISHLSILDPNSVNNKNVITNIKNFNGINLSASNFQSNQSVLVFNPDIIKNNIENLQKYELISSLSNTSDLKFFTSNNLEDIIDSLLELGFENQLHNSLDLLNYSISDIKKMAVILRIDPSIEYEELIKIIDNNSVNISNEEEYLFNYLDFVNVSDFKMTTNDLKNSMEKYSVTPLTYSINGIKISKNRILRLIENANSGYINLKTINDKVFKNLYLSEESYNMLIHEIFSKDVKEVIK